ncbi:diguanylate cyclase [Bacillus sp. REN10]|uniref:GGDEF domain-containing response regulator n=1 Tax=Bacillus sp. REN10 TaxID=2782541 RepID=UPI00193B75DC|nr:diguanylate cyclase [Bacillus sp. REN10]
MSKEQYQQIMYERMQVEFQKWGERTFILEQELYFFLHTLKGTAGTMGLHEMSMIATEKLTLLKENGQTEWQTSEWQEYFSPLIEGVAFYTKNGVVSHQENQDCSLLKEQSVKDFILVIDDDITFMTFMKDLLEREGYSVILAHHGQRGLELMYEIKPAMIFLDITLPDINGFTVLEDIMNKVRKERVVVAMISEDNSPDNQIRSYQIGALDFLIKPINPEVLLAYVHNRLMYKRDLERSIITDELTQLYNRKYMNASLQQLIQQFERTAEPFTIAMIDLDDFKKINDTYGHLVGDEVLQSFAAWIKKIAGDQYIGCRYGGEEFVLLLPNSTTDTAHHILEQLREAMAQQIFSAKGEEFQVTFSAGIAQAKKDKLHPEQLLEEADQALYLAKQSGRNQRMVFGSHMEEVKKRVKVTIIVVDDVYVVREMITNYFASWQSSNKYEIEVVPFSDGVTFLESDWYTSEGKYIILLDGMMPIMDGIDVLKKLRASYSSNNVLVLMLTGQKSEEDILKALELGANDYILKPFDIQEVSERILRLIERLYR